MQKLRDEFGDHPARLPDWPLLAARMAPWIREIAAHGRLNLLLSDGHALLAHASTQLHWLERHAPFRSVRLRDAEHSLDLAIHNSPNDHMSLVATQPLTHDEPWQAFAPQEIRLFEQGRSAWVDRPRAA
jgi:glutamine amidotransferase